MKKSIFLFFILYMHFSSASVVMTGTRIIFPAGNQEKTIQFKNVDAQPYIVQVNIASTGEAASAEAPFIAIPPVFRIEPHHGQSVRLISVKSARLPQDRESVFYMDFTQVPPLKTADRVTNQLIIAVKSRVKLFYRPDALHDQQSHACRSLQFSVKGGNMIVKNPTGFYISISQARFVRNDISLPLTQITMLAPFSSAEWAHVGNLTSLNGGKVKLTRINDYGAYVEETLNL